MQTESGVEMLKSRWAVQVVKTLFNPSLVCAAASGQQSEAAICLQQQAAAELVFSDDPTVKVDSDGLLMLIWGQYDEE